MSTESLYTILEEMEEAGVLEDRREYSVEDLMVGYSLDTQEAEDLHYLIQRTFDPSFPKDPTPSHIPSWIHKEYYHEASHSSFEGFTEHETVVIQKYYDDMCRYWKYAIKDEGRDPTTGRKPNTTYGSEKADQ
jgi:hypothetical protein